MRDTTDIARELTFRKDFTNEEWKLRARHIATLRNFAGASVAAAKALAEIRDKKLYRPHKSLKEFCQRECGFTEQRMYQIIKFAKVRAALPAKTKRSLSSEWQSRELEKVPEDQRAEVLDEANRFYSKDGQEPTAAEIKRAAVALDALEVTLDDNGKVIPSLARKYWDRRNQAKEVMSALRAAKRAVNALDINDVMWIEVGLNGLLGDLSNAISRFISALPAYVCPYCKGTGIDKGKKCDCCTGRGVVSKYMWDHHIPEEMKK